MTALLTQTITGEVRFNHSEKAIAGGVLPDGAMCPKMTVKELVRELCMHFNARFRFDVKRRTWGLYLFKDPNSINADNVSEFVHDFSYKQDIDAGERIEYTESDWTRQTWIGYAAPSQGERVIYPRRDITYELTFSRPSFQLTKDNEYAYESQFGFTPSLLNLSASQKHLPYIPVRRDGAKSVGILSGTSNLLTQSMTVGMIVCDKRFRCYKAKVSRNVGTGVNLIDFDQVNYLDEVGYSEVAPRLVLIDRVAVSDTVNTYSRGGSMFDVRLMRAFVHQERLFEFGAEVEDFKGFTFEGTNPYR
ncbi:MAG: hypothetical protein EBX40_06385 [Gammaproteobacteria bacterium]|nr:hypothetical protein [Gammaproteobacteria bacterium]